MNWNFRGQRWIVSDLKWQDLAWLIVTVSLTWFRITLEIVLWLCVWGHPHGGFTEEEAILTWMWALLSHGPGDWGESKGKEKASWAPLSTFLCFLTCWDVSTAGGHSCAMLPWWVMSWNLSWSGSFLPYTEGSLPGTQGSTLIFFPYKTGFFQFLNCNLYVLSQEIFCMNIFSSRNMY